MKYTLQSGVEHPLLPKYTDNLRFILPLLAILLLMVIFGLSHHRGGQHSPKPLTLGIYTVKTPASSNDSSATSGGSSASSGTDNQPISSTISGSSLGGIQPSSGPVLAASSDSIQSGTSPVQSSAPPVPATFPCLDLSTGLNVTCTYQACTPPVTLIGSQKAFLTLSGTCAVVN